MRRFLYDGALLVEPDKVMTEEEKVAAGRRETNERTKFRGCCRLPVPFPAPVDGASAWPARELQF